MRAVLTLEQKTMPPRSHVIRVGESFTIGRGREATLRVEDERVSRKHLAITLTAGGIEVADLGSRNGTRVNGRVLAPNERMLAGRFVHVELGSATLTVEVEQAGQDNPRTRRLDTGLVDLQDELEVLGEIGHGSAGRVFVARERSSGRTLAVKALRPQFGPGSAGRERFIREARLARRIASPHVVQVEDCRVVDDRAYIMMELVQGPSVRDRLALGSLSLAESLSIGEDVANALAAATLASVVHRDVKPGNILIDADGSAKLADFGIAKDLDGSRIQTLTKTGDGLGTLAYISPEQAEDAKEVDYRTDIYGLGATLFHMLAGRPPFLPTSARVLLDILEKPAPPITAFRTDVPEDVERLVASMLEKDPDRRPQTAHEVAGLLHEIRRRHNLARSAGSGATFGGRATDDDLPALGSRERSPE
jgi:serine/threonine protein kinase